LQSAKSTTIGSTWIILTLHYQVRQLSGKYKPDQFQIDNQPLVLRPQYEGEEDDYSQLSSTGNSDEMVPPYYPGTEIDGYMPHRGDFTVESDDIAEGDIAGLTPEPDDSQMITALKLVAVKIYCCKLRQRAYRKRIVRDYGLLDIRKQLGRFTSCPTVIHTNAFFSLLP